MRDKNFQEQSGKNLIHGLVLGRDWAATSNYLMSNYY